MFATIDIGTNSILLLIGQSLPDGRVRIIADEARIARLGEGIADHENLLPDAIERTISILADYRQLCEKHHVSAISAVSTEALRRASNAKELIEKAKEKLDINIEIISAEQESWFTYRACAHDFGPDILVCDVGGGSTELIWGKSNLSEIKGQRDAGTGHQFLSIPMGAVVLTEHFIKSDPITPEEFHELVLIIDQHLAQTLHSFSHRHAEKLVATAGTATTLAAMNKHMVSYDHNKIHGTILEMLDVQVIIDELKAKSVAERRKIPGLQRGREDIILAGAVILDRIMRRLGYDVATVSDRGLRWGLFYERFTQRPIR